MSKVILVIIVQAITGKIYSSSSTPCSVVFCPNLPEPLFNMASEKVANQKVAGLEAHSSSPEYSEVEHAPRGSELPWWKQQNLRQLYLMMPFLFLGSTTLGYDGSLLNGLQTMQTWRDCKTILLLATRRTSTCP